MALNDEVIRLLLGHALGVVTRHHGLWQTLGIFCISKAQVIDRVGTLGFKHPAIGSIAIGANALTTCIQIENFSGKSVESIRQDFFAKQVPHNLTALLAAGAQVDTRFQARKQQYKNHNAQALSSMKNQIIHLLRGVNIQPLAQALLERCAQNIEASRPSRRFMRNVSNLHQNLFFTAYKACR